ncbi:MAG: gliding motility-associated C-terminal domain-containing protein [Chitinophagaceae bacterium]
MGRYRMMKIIAFAILLSALIPFIAGAQTCTGSLGDPLINETFGTGHYIVPEKKTSFPFIGGCPTKGTYTTSSFLFGCGDVPGAWTKMIGDHTGDGGNYMLVNGESHPGIVYIDTAKSLCGNTVYQFGIWVTSVMTTYACGGNAALPDLLFEIKSTDGTILSSGSTGALPLVDDRNWIFYNLVFTTPADIGDAVVKISINSELRCGSGFAIDDISLRPCGPMITAQIDGTDAPQDVCSGYTNPFVMTANYTPGYSDPVFQWQSSADTGKTWTDIPGETSLMYTVPRRDSGVILYRIAIAERSNIGSVRCRIVSNYIYTNIHPIPANIPPQDVFGCLDKDYLFPRVDYNALAVEWTGPNGYSSTDRQAIVPSIQFTDAGTYVQKSTFYYGCFTLDTFNLKVYPSTTIAVQPALPLCEGKSEQLVASATDSVGYQWIPSTGLSDANIPNPVASPKDSTIYEVYATNKYGCKDSATVVINVYRNPVADAGPDKTILIGDTATLNGVVRGTAINYSWLPSSYLSSAEVPAPKSNPPVSTNYTLSVTSTVGCGSASDEVIVKVYDDLFIPSAFSPNGDGKNDIFRIMAIENIQLKRFQIFNRWGQSVYQSTGSFNGWDGNLKGQPQPAGVYVYYLELLNKKGEKITRRGTILLVR